MPSKPKSVTRAEIKAAFAAAYTQPHWTPEFSYWDGRYCQWRGPKASHLSYHYPAPRTPAGTSASTRSA